MSSHEAHESKKVSEELRHHQFGAAHKEISHEMHSHPREFEHLLKSINHDLAKHNQNPLSVERDSKNHISHINFNNHDIYSGSQSNSSLERHAAGHSGSPAGAGEGHGHHAARHHGKHHGKHHGHGRHESDESDEQPDSNNPQSNDNLKDKSKDPGKDPADRSKLDSPDAKKGDEANKQSKNPLQAMADVVKDVAKDLGLTRTATVAAVASMLQESGGDPNKPGDYGKKDHKPHSFGLFQLNFRGGEGTEAGITPKQALDPHTNASIALQYFRKHQHLNDPAQIAALAQRPSDKRYHQHVAAYVPEAERLLGDR